MNFPPVTESARPTHIVTFQAGFAPQSVEDPDREALNLASDLLTNRGLTVFRLETIVPSDPTSPPGLRVVTLTKGLRVMNLGDHLAAGVPTNWERREVTVLVAWTCGGDKEMAAHYDLEREAGLLSTDRRVTSLNLAPVLEMFADYPLLMPEGTRPPTCAGVELVRRQPDGSLQPVTLAEAQRVAPRNAVPKGPADT